MFTGMTVASLVADAQTIGAIFNVAILAYGAFWAGRRMLNIARSFFSG
jgi:hypothetical protein